MVFIPISQAKFKGCRFQKELIFFFQIKDILRIYRYIVGFFFFLFFYFMIILTFFAPHALANQTRFIHDFSHAIQTRFIHNLSLSPAFRNERVWEIQKSPGLLSFKGKVNRPTQPLSFVIDEKADRANTLHIYITRSTQRAWKPIIHFEMRGLGQVFSIVEHKQTCTRYQCWNQISWGQDIK